jgi:hypothetical protein
MYVGDDHDEAPDHTGYFRKSGWHEGFFSSGGKGRILIIGDKTEKPPKKKVFSETMALVRHLIADETLVPGQYNGLKAHRAFADALATYPWEDPSEPYLNVMCNFKQYLDRQYAVPFCMTTTARSRGNLPGNRGLCGKDGENDPAGFFRGRTV